MQIQFIINSIQTLKYKTPLLSPVMSIRPVKDVLHGQAEHRTISDCTVVHSRAGKTLKNKTILLIFYTSYTIGEAGG